MMVVRGHWISVFFVILFSMGLCTSASAQIVWDYTWYDAYSEASGYYAPTDTSFGSIDWMDSPNPPASAESTYEYETQNAYSFALSDEGHLNIESTTASGTEHSEARSIPTAEFQGGFYAMDIPEYKFTFSVSYSISAWGDDSLSEVSYQVEVWNRTKDLQLFSEYFYDSIREGNKSNTIEYTFEIFEDTDFSPGDYIEVYTCLGMVWDYSSNIGNTEMFADALQEVTPGPDICEGNFDGDKDVDGSDLATFANAYAAGDLQADLNGDKEVNMDDLEMFAIDFGKTDCQ